MRAVQRPQARLLPDALPLPAGERLSPAQRARFEGYLTEMLAALGLDLDTDGTRDTPARLLAAWIDSTSGYVPDPKLVTTFPLEGDASQEGGHAQVIEGPIAFSALCEHHALPFLGRAWIGYVPRDRVIGLSKLTRLAHQFSRRFTMQERMGREVAVALEAIVSPRGVAVRIEAEHLCTRMRGVREASAVTSSIVWRGDYARSAALRTEFLALCSRT